MRKSLIAFALVAVLVAQVSISAQTLDISSLLYRLVEVLLQQNTLLQQENASLKANCLSPNAQNATTGAKTPPPLSTTKPAEKKKPQLEVRPWEQYFIVV